MSKIEIDCDVDHKKCGNRSRDEAREIAKDEGCSLIGSRKLCLGHTAIKEKTKSSN